MDNNQFHNDQLGENQLEENQLEENQFKEKQLQPEEAEKKGHFGLGIFIGILSTIAVCAVGILIYTKAFNGFLVIGDGQGSTVVSSDVLDDETVDKVNELKNYIDLYYYEDYDTEDLQDNLLSGMMDGLGDPYSVYYTKEEYDDLKISTSGTYYGIGCGLKQDSDTMVVTISKVYEGTPAEEAGLQKDDIIVSANGEDATSMEVDELVQIIRGEEGTTVSLEIYRSSTNETFTVDVERRNVELPSVSGKLVEDDIAYIQVSEFQSGTYEQFVSTLEDLENQGATSLIVDLRDNPGGMLTTVVSMLDYILPEGTVVYTEDKYGEQEVYSSEASCIDLPMAVLINGNSASASEIFAGAIQDYDYGTIIGTQSFGKGIVQTIFPLEDGDALKITTAKYFTPNGNYIHGVGITPDIELEYEYSGDTSGDYDMQYDNQVQKAIEVLNGK